MFALYIIIVLSIQIILTKTFYLESKNISF